MSFTRLDDLVANAVGYPSIIGKDPGTAEAAGVPHTPWYQSGIIGAGAAPGGGLNGATFTGPGVAGSIPIPAAVTAQFIKLTRWAMTQAGNIGHVWLIDRLWGNVPVVTTTTSQAVTSPTFPARDAAASTAGGKVFLALECSSATGNGGAVTSITATYTNSAGTAGRTATVPSWPATAAQGTFVPLSHQAGDDGVRAVSAYNQGGSSLTSGQVHLVAYRLIAELALPQANVGSKAGFADLGLPSVWDNSVLQMVYFPTGTALGTLAGSCSFAQG